MQTSVNNSASGVSYNCGGISSSTRLQQELTTSMQIAALRLCFALVTLSYVESAAIGSYTRSARSKVSDSSFFGRLVDTE